MFSKKHTPGFIGGLIGFVLGLAISFAATVAIRGAYNKSAEEFDGRLARIDELGLTYRTLLSQDHESPVPPMPKFKKASAKEQGLIECCNDQAGNCCGSCTANSP